MTIPELRHTVFDGIELADTVTIDGHKSFYCYYPCGGLLIRTTRWAQTFSAGHSAYISEDENWGAVREGILFGQALEQSQKSKDVHTTVRVGQPYDPRNSLLKDEASYRIDEKTVQAYDAVQALLGRAVPEAHSELAHQPFNQYLEGSRGPQGIMQLYFNLATLGLRGYDSILGWTTLLRERCEEAISLGMSDLRRVTDDPPLENLCGSDKTRTIFGSRLGASSGRRPPATVVPIAGGRFLRLTAGECNQVLITYVPAREAKLIVSAPRSHWTDGDKLLRLMRYLWRINDHLWQRHIYANPAFTYYVGHTALELVCSTDDGGPKRLAKLLTSWNAWTFGAAETTPFFEVLAEAVAASKLPQEQRPHGIPFLEEYAQKFFCHKVVIMHPYTDESLLGDMLRRLAFWGGRSAADVPIADATARFFFPETKPKRRRKQHPS